MDSIYTHGAWLHKDGSCTFKVWAPATIRMVLSISFPTVRRLEMEKTQDGFFIIQLADITPETRYCYMPEDNGTYPDPASFYQPDGVHQASAIVDHHSFTWNDSHWKGIPQQGLIFYEIHTGTFTNEGTFDAIINKLDYLLDLGINAIELMPVAQFPGRRNWGYDGTYPYAVQNSYGEPDGLKRLVDTCHLKGIAVFLDVVYNHLGPEGNYFKAFGPYFTDKYKTPWGDTINYDGALSDPVRDFFSDNIIYWLEYYHIDGLRLDAIHTIYDNGAVSLWSLIHDKVERLQQRTGRTYTLIAESDLNSPRVVDPIEKNGFGFQAQWLDDFHHAIYVLLHPEGHEFYVDFGKIEQVTKAFEEGFVHTGEYVIARQRKHGASSKGIPGYKFVAFNQNHDQVGNRVDGARISVLMDQKRLELAAALLFLSPHIPLLFMGEEYGETAPFLYFIDHSESELIAAVRAGRKRDFEAFHKNTDPPDPQLPETFQQSHLNWELVQVPKHKALLNWYKSLIKLRKSSAALQNTEQESVKTTILSQSAFCLMRTSQDKGAKLLAVFNFSDETLNFELDYPGSWQVVMSNDNLLTYGKCIDFISGIILNGTVLILSEV
jgi:maltooligosyltrehalose trehalohydrolase